MVIAERTHRRDRIAIASSIAIHLCVLAALLALPRPAFPTDDPDERLLVAGVVRIEHRPPPARLRTHRALAEPGSAPPAVRPVVHAAASVAHADRPLVVAREDRARVIAARAPRRVATVDPAAAAGAVPTPYAAQPTADVTGPTPAATPTVAPSAALALRDEGIGNFGETYPAALEPQARSALLAAIPGPFAVRVVVDESGRAVSVEFVRAPPDAAQREALRSRVLALRFIPAACNGLRCNGTLELRN